MSAVRSSERGGFGGSVWTVEDLVERRAEERDMGEEGDEIPRLDSTRMQDGMQGEDAQATKRTLTNPSLSTTINL